MEATNIKEEGAVRVADKALFSVHSDASVTLKRCSATYASAGTDCTLIECKDVGDVSAARVARLRKCVDVGDVHAVSAVVMEDCKRVASVLTATTYDALRCDAVASARCLNARLEKCTALGELVLSGGSATLIECVGKRVKVLVPRMRFVDFEYNHAPVFVRAEMNAVGGARRTPVYTYPMRALANWRDKPPLQQVVRLVNSQLEEVAFDAGNGLLVLEHGATVQKHSGCTLRVVEDVLDATRHMAPTFKKK